MKEFVDKWKELNTRFALTLKYDRNLCRNVVDLPDLRKLTMESEEDVWFVEKTSQVPRPEG